MKNITQLIGKPTMYHAQADISKKDSQEPVKYIFSTCKFLTEFLPELTSFRQNPHLNSAQHPARLNEEIHPDDKEFVIAAREAVVKKFDSSARKHKHISASIQFRKVCSAGKTRLIKHVITPAGTYESPISKMSVTETDITTPVIDPVKIIRVYGQEEQESLGVLRLEGFEHDSDVCPFSSRQLEILKLLAEGKKTAQIAESLFISVDTVRTHRQHILQKSAHANMTATVVDCVRKGWF